MSKLHFSQKDPAAHITAMAGKTPARPSWILAWAAAILTLTAAQPAAAKWVLVDQGACEGPIVSLSEEHEPLPENCTPATAGKVALCHTEVCRPHCLYFNHPLEQCPPGADLGKRYVCVPD